MNKDADGMERWDAVITRETRTGTTETKLYGMHEQELETAKQAARRQTRRGDTLTIKVI